MFNMAPIGRGVSMSDDYNEEQTEKMSKEEKKAYGDYNGQCQAEDDLSTLMRAEEIKQDSERLKKAKYCGKIKKESLSGIISG